MKESKDREEKPLARNRPLEDRTLIKKNNNKPGQSVIVRNEKQKEPKSLSRGINTS